MYHNKKSRNQEIIPIGWQKFKINRVVLISKTLNSISQNDSDTDTKTGKNQF